MLSRLTRSVRRVGTIEMPDTVLKPLTDLSPVQRTEPRIFLLCHSGVATAATIANHVHCLSCFAKSRFTLLLLFPGLGELRPSVGCSDKVGPLDLTHKLWATLLPTNFTMDSMPRSCTLPRPCWWIRTPARRWQYSASQLFSPVLRCNAEISKNDGK
jgi:hypothetical protein